jgi:hypothetical protein
MPLPASRRPASQQRVDSEATVAPCDGSRVRNSPRPDVDERHQPPLTREQRIDQELAESFPASDPPSWVQGITR